MATIYKLVEWEPGPDEVMYVDTPWIELEQGDQYLNAAGVHCVIGAYDDSLEIVLGEWDVVHPGDRNNLKEIVRKIIVKDTKKKR